MPPQLAQPTYDLEEIKRLVRGGAACYRIEPIAVNGAGALKLDEKDIVACVLALDCRPRREGGDFHKTMASNTRPGTFQDVYRPQYLGRRIYCKLQIMTTKRGDVAAVIQFKRDKSQ
jgi:hypothetical protein